MYIIRITYFILFISFLSFKTNAQYRKEINIPDIEGYITLKCDFHTYTVFSDGYVWPTVRIDEAWEEGLDAIAISDLINYRPHSVDITADHNRSFDVANPTAVDKKIILIKAAEISDNIPPENFNALFINNANLLERENIFDALREAKDQGAFIFWNPPGNEIQQPDSFSWWEDHKYLIENDLVDGIEVYNTTTFYPKAFEWSIEEKLTLLCNSNLRSPSSLQYDLVENHRPITLVFAKNRSRSSIKDALLNRRTVAYFDNFLWGERKFVEQIFTKSIIFENTPLLLENYKVIPLIIKNNSDIDYILELIQPPMGFECPENIILKSHRSTLIELRGVSEEVSDLETLDMYFMIKNIYTAPNENLIITLSPLNL